MNDKTYRKYEAELKNWILKPWRTMGALFSITQELGKEENKSKKDKKLRNKLYFLSLLNYSIMLSILFLLYFAFKIPYLGLVNYGYIITIIILASKYQKKLQVKQ